MAETTAMIILNGHVGPEPQQVMVPQPGVTAAATGLVVNSSCSNSSPKMGSIATAAAAINGSTAVTPPLTTTETNNNVTVNGHKTQQETARRRGDPRYLDVIRERPIRVTVKVLVPVREHPKFNFVGKLLGPKGNSMKRLQEETMTKMAVLGRGSMRDKQKEEDLRASGDPKYVHLAEDLHVEITAFAAPAEAHARIAYSLAEVRRYLVPDNNDDIRKEQIREMELFGDGTEVVAGSGSSSNSNGSSGQVVTTTTAGGGVGGGGGGGRDRPVPPLSPPELLPGEVSDLRGGIVAPPPPPGPPLPPGLRGPRLPPPHPHHPRLLPPHRPLPPMVRKLPPSMQPALPPPPVKRRVLSILDKAKLALDCSYGLHDEDPRHYSFEHPEFAYEDYEYEDFAEVYNGEAYDGIGGGRWLGYKPSLPSALEQRVRCRTSPYARPK